MTGLARVLSVEGARYHINVNVVCPAASSRMTDPTNLEVRRGPDSGKALPGGDAMDRMAPEYVSALVTYLCHHSCDSSGCFYHVRRALAPLCDRASACLHADTRHANARPGAVGTARWSSSRPTASY